MRIDDSDPILRILLIRKRIFFGFSRDVTTTPTRLFRGVDELKKDTLGRFQPFLILLVLLVLAVFVLDLDIGTKFRRTSSLNRGTGFRRPATMGNLHEMYKTRVKKKKLGSAWNTKKENVDEFSTKQPSFVKRKSSESSGRVVDKNNFSKSPKKKGKFFVFFSSPLSRAKICVTA